MNRAEIEKKVKYYCEEAWNAPFLAIQRTLNSVQKALKPITSEYRIMQYNAYFLRRIDFDKIVEGANDSETLNYCNAIYQGLEQMLKGDVEGVISKFQNKITKLKKSEAEVIHKNVIQEIGVLRVQLKNSNPQSNFTQRYLELIENAKKGDLFPYMDYSLIIEHFNESLFGNILSSYEIIEQTLEKVISTNVNDKGSIEPKVVEDQPLNFEDLFYDPTNCDVYLDILRDLDKPPIDAFNNYIGKAKGIFPLWIKVLKRHKPKPLIKHFKDSIYRDLLNEKVKGLDLTKDSSEFRKVYKRLVDNNIELEIQAILSQYSQDGKLGK